MAAAASADGWVAEVVDRTTRTTADHPVVTWGDDHMSGTLLAWSCSPTSAAWVRVVRDDDVDTERYAARGYTRRQSSRPD